MWEKVKTSLIVGASAVILTVYAPPVLMNPFVTAVSQMRLNSAPIVSEGENNSSVQDAVVNTVKKALK